MAKMKKRVTMTSVSENVTRILIATGKNTKCYNHFTEQFVSFIKS